MTAPDSKLVELVANVLGALISKYLKERGYHPPLDVMAKAAIAACHAEEMRGVLQRIGKALAEQPVLILTGDLLEALEAGRDVLAKLDGQA